MARAAFYCIAFLCLALACPAWADTLSMQTSMTISVGQGKIHVQVSITNKGTASAHKLAAHLFLLETKLKSPEISELAPGQTQNVSYDKPWPVPLAGEFPAVLLLTYQDEAGYPFSALHCNAFKGRQSPDPDLSAKAADFAISQKGSVSAWVSYPGKAPKLVSARLVLPNELDSPKKATTLKLSGGAAQQLAFEVENRSALPGATYPVYILFEYEDGPTHHTVVSQAMAMVGSPESWFRRTRRVWIVAACLLVAALLAGGAMALRKRTGA